MKIFIAWSKDASGAIGNALRDFLLQIHPSGFTPFTSKANIAYGEDWNDILEEELRRSHYGVLCVTEENLNSPWLWYEAGALGVSTVWNGGTSKPHVAPVLFGNVNSDKLPAPIRHFQVMKFSRENLLALAQQLNELCRSVDGDDVRRLDASDIKTNFEKAYPTLEKEIQAILDEAEETRFREKLDEFDEALKDFRRDNGDDEMAQMGNLLSGKLRAEGLTENGRKFANAYLELLRSNENAENAASARRLRSAISELYC